MGCALIDASGENFEAGWTAPSATLFTAAAWVKAASISDYDHIFQLGTSARSTLKLSTTFGFSVESNGNVVNDQTPAVSTGSWYYAAISCGGTGASDLKGYLWDDTGTLLIELTGTGYSHSAGYFYFGGGNSGGYSINGRLADGRCWDAVLSQSELEAEMFSRSVVHTTDFNSGFVDVTNNYIAPQASRVWTIYGATQDSDTPPVSGGGGGSSSIAVLQNYYSRMRA
jgi:hypothetical protein